MAMPATMPAPIPSRGLPVLIVMAKAATAPTDMMPSAPRLRTPDFSVTNSPRAVRISGVPATMVAKRTAETRPGAMANPLLSSAVQPQPEVDEYVGSQNEEQQQTLEHFRDGIG